VDNHGVSRALLIVDVDVTGELIVSKLRTTLRMTRRSKRLRYRTGSMADRPAAHNATHRESNEPYEQWRRTLSRAAAAAAPTLAPLALNRRLGEALEALACVPALQDVHDAEEVPHGEVPLARDEPTQCGAARLPAVSRRLLVAEPTRGEGVSGSQPRRQVVSRYYLTATSARDE
jgi:hypothetical protein